MLIDSYLIKANFKTQTFFFSANNKHGIIVGEKSEWEDNKNNHYLLIWMSNITSISIFEMSNRGKVRKIINVSNFPKSFFLYY